MCCTARSFKNAGGLRPGAEVHYADGPPIGRVEDVHSDPHDSTRMEITFRVKPEIPVKTDSTAAISSSSPLSDNFLEIVPGSNAAQRAPAGSALKSKEYVGLDELEAEIADLGPQAKVLLTNLNARVTELQVTVARVNDVLNDRNRENLSASLGNVRAVLEENRKPLHSTVAHFDEASAKIAPLLDDLKKTNADAQKTINTLEGTISENRGDLHQSIEELRRRTGHRQQRDRPVGPHSERQRRKYRRHPEQFPTSVAELAAVHGNAEAAAVHVAAFGSAAGACARASIETGVRGSG